MPLGSGEGAKAGANKIDAIIMDLVLVEMGAAAVSAAAEPVGGGKGASWK